MADNDTKTADDSNDAEWELVYWPTQNRGNHIRTLFEEAGVKYKECDYSDVKITTAYVKNSIRSSTFGASTKDINDNELYHCMAPPIIKGNDDFVLSQTIPIMQYLSNKLNLRPKSNEDNARALMIMSNLNDFHAELMLYGMNTNPKVGLSEYLSSGRGDLWLKLAERPLRLDKSKDYYFDNKCTAVDLFVWNILDGFKQFLGDVHCKKYFIEKYPVLYAHYLKISNRESVKGLVEKQKKLKLIWWHPLVYNLKGSVWEKLK